MERDWNKWNHSPTLEVPLLGMEEVLRLICYDGIFISMQKKTTQYLEEHT
jgi:hypothetical protein